MSNESLHGLKIVHVFKDVLPPVRAGITRYIRDIAEASALKGAAVDVHVCGVKRETVDVQSSGVIIHRHREIGRVLSTPISPSMIRALRRVDADIIHVHMPNPIGELGVAISRSDARVICTFHARLGRQRILEPLYAPMRRRILSRASMILVGSRVMAEASELATARDRTRVLPYGISPAFGELDLLGDRRDQPLRLLFVGRLVYYKGVDVLIEALAQTPNVLLTVVGDGPLRAELQALVERYAILDRVRFLGEIEDDAVTALHRTHDVFVLPSTSRAESFGLAMAEAMGRGLPAISTRLGTATDWVNCDGESGLVVEPNDAGALANAIRALTDESLRKRLAGGASVRAHRLFSFDAHIETLVRFYQEVLAS